MEKKQNSRHILLTSMQKYRQKYTLSISLGYGMLNYYNIFCRVYNPFSGEQKEVTWGKAEGYLYMQFSKWTQWPLVSFNLGLQWFHVWRQRIWVYGGLMELKKLSQTASPEATLKNVFMCYRPTDDQEMTSQKPALWCSNLSHCSEHTYPILEYWFKSWLLCFLPRSPLMHPGKQ